MSDFEQFNKATLVGTVIEADSTFEDSDYIRLPAKGEDSILVSRAAYQELSKLIPNDKSLTFAQQIDNPTPSAFDYFGAYQGVTNYGELVDMSGDGERIIIGNPGSDDGGGGFTETGEVYIYKWNGSIWAFEASILNPSPSITAETFGRTVKIDQNGIRIAVSSYRSSVTHGQYSGAVWVFSRSGTTWTLEQRIDPIETAQDSQRFGENITHDEHMERIFVGAPYVDRNLASGADNHGRGYVFVRSGSTWTLEQAMSGYYNRPDGYVGKFCKMNKQGNVLFVNNGNTLYYTSADHPTIEVFFRNGSSWLYKGRIFMPMNSTMDTGFGTSTPAYHQFGEIELVESPSGNGGDEPFLFVSDFTTYWDYESGGFLGFEGGMVYLYDISAFWKANYGYNTLDLKAALIQVLTPPAISEYTSYEARWFGKRIKATPDGKYVIISSPVLSNSTTDLYYGEAYLYKKNGFGYELEQTISNPSVGVNRFFGSEFAINDDFTRAIFGVVKTVSGQTNAGSVCAFDIEEDTTNMKFDPVDNPNTYLRIK
jgi:hypothetical protein